MYIYIYIYIYIYKYIAKIPQSNWNAVISTRLLRWTLSSLLLSPESGASPYHFRIRRDFRSKNPLSRFAPKQTKESSALAGHPYSATVD